MILTFTSLKFKMLNFSPTYGLRMTTLEQISMGKRSIKSCLTLYWINNNIS